MAPLSTCHLELVVWDGNLVKNDKHDCLPVGLPSRRSRCSGLVSRQTAAPAPNCPCTGWLCAVPSSGTPSHASHHASVKGHRRGENGISKLDNGLSQSE